MTGAGGLLGAAISKVCSQHYEVFSGFREHMPMFGNPVVMDFRNLDGIEKQVDLIKPEVIVHAAALTDVDKCEISKDLAYRVNYRGTATLSKSAANIGAFLIYISTDAVFDGEKGGYQETDEPRPINYYGETKLLGEVAVTGSGVDYCIARTSVIYGARPAAGKVNFALWLLESLLKRERVSVLEDQYVSPTLNTNLAQMVLEAVEGRLAGTFHMAGASKVSRHQFAKAIAETFGLDSSLIMPARMSEMKWVARRPRDSTLDVSKATSALKKKPIHLADAMLKLKQAISGVDV